ncbi:MAG TPA: DUF4190 domain-containing protein [Planctomycetes bacterium]|nr:DUF4190 domain-containing protein [Planctomycetota bacterium]
MVEGTQPPPETVEAQPVTQQPLRSHRGILILVLGILSIVCCFICGIITWVLANGDLKEMAAGRMDQTGRGLTKAGKICGIVGIVVQIVWIVLWLLGVGFLTIFGVSHVPQ